MALAGVFSKVAFASKVPVLLKATSDDSNPTPGYLYDEIAKITNESLEQCDNLVSFLVERVKKTSVHTKLKALLVIKAVLQKGNPEFRHSLRQSADSIRDAKSFSGPPDALCGDHYFVEIRKAAAMVLEILFDVSNSATPPSALSTADKGRMEGPRKMEGYGNTVSPANNSIGSSINRFASNIWSLGKWQNEGTADGNYQTVADRERPTYSTPSQSITSVFQGNRTPSQADWSTSSTRNLTSNSQCASSGLEAVGGDSFRRQDWKMIGMGSPVQGMTEDRPYEQIRTQPKSSSIQESKIVDEFTSPGGIRVAIHKEELNVFLKRCHTLDLAKIISCLRIKLDNPNSQVQLRALILLESLLDSNLDNVNDLILQDCYDKITEMKKSGNSAIKSKTDKLLMTLNPQVFAPAPPDISSQLLLNGEEGQCVNDQLAEAPGDVMHAFALSDVFPEATGKPRVDNEDLLSGTAPNEQIDNTSSLFLGLTLSQKGDASDVISKQGGRMQVKGTKSGVHAQTSGVSASDSLGSGLDPFGDLNQYRSASETQEPAKVSSGERDLKDLLDLDPFSGSRASRSSMGVTLGALTTSNVSSLQRIQTSMVAASSAQNLSPITSCKSVGDSRQLSPSAYAVPSCQENSGMNLLHFMSPQSSSSESSGNHTLISLDSTEVRNTQPQYPVRAQFRPAPYLGGMRGNYSRQGHPQSHGVPFPHHTIPQRMPAHPRGTSSFDFISKKGDAFDFVKDAIEQSKKKK